MDCNTLLFPKTGMEGVVTDGIGNFEDYSISEFEHEVKNHQHPLEIYQSMISEKSRNSMQIHDPNFEYKNLRKKLCDRVFELGDVFEMDTLTLHQCMKYLETVLHFVNFYQRNNRQQKLPTDPKPVKEIVLKTSPFFGKDTSMRIKALTTVKKELIMITCLLIAAKFNERDENLVKITELQKE
jgi:hypothetical protein